MQFSRLAVSNLTGHPIQPGRLPNRRSQPEWREEVARVWASQRGSLSAWRACGERQQTFGSGARLFMLGMYLPVLRQFRRHNAQGYFIMLEAIRNHGADAKASPGGDRRERAGCPSNFYTNFPMDERDSSRRGIGQNELSGKTASKPFGAGVIISGCRRQSPNCHQCGNRAADDPEHFSGSRYRWQTDDRQRRSGSRKLDAGLREGLRQRADWHRQKGFLIG